MAIRSRYLVAFIIQAMLIGHAYAYPPPTRCPIGQSCPGNAVYNVDAGIVTQQANTTCAPEQDGLYFPGGALSSQYGTNATATKAAGSCLSYTVTSPGPFTINAEAYTTSGPSYSAHYTVTGTWQPVNPSGNVKLKYQVLGVDYAPPGAKSTVNYGGSTMRGTSTSNSSTWTNNTSVSVSLSAKAGFIFANAGGGVTNTDSYSEEGDSSNSVTVGTTTSQADIIPGPASSATGVDHDYDVIWVWLNPEVNMTLTGPSQIQWNGYLYDAEDDANEMEVVPIYVIELKNPSLMSAGLAARLARTWDKSTLGGLTAQDYAAILSADPFAANPSFNPNTDTSGRYDLQVGQTFSYNPAPAGGQPLTQTYSLVSQSTSSVGKGSSDTRSVGMAIDTFTSVGNDIGIFSAKFSLDVKVSDTYTSTSKWSSAINGGVGQTAALSITAPASSDNYTGPTTIQVWKDNVYGSFMFYGVQ